MNNMEYDLYGIWDMFKSDSTQNQEIKDTKQNQ